MRFKAIGVIPARWGSTRFPGKPLHEIAGKPLLRHVWERCRRARRLDALMIATDDMRIADAASSWGAEVVLTSPRHRSGTDRAGEASRKRTDVTHVINIQGDEPLVDPALINRLAEAMRRDRSIHMITAAHPFERANDATSPHQVKVVVDRHGRALYFSRTPVPHAADSLPPPTYLRHQGIYGYTRAVLLQFVRWRPTPLEKAEGLEQLRALENGVTVHVLVTKHGWPGIDTPEDAIALEQILARSKRKDGRR